MYVYPAGDEAVGVSPTCAQFGETVKTYVIEAVFEVSASSVAVTTILYVPSLLLSVDETVTSPVTAFVKLIIELSTALPP